MRGSSVSHASDPAKLHWLTLSLACWFVLSAAPLAGAATYHLCSRNGDDAADGLSPKSAWRGLAKVADIRLGPGNQVLLKSGSAWKGTLTLKGAGRADRPILVGRYGKGKLPVIDGNGGRRAVLLENPSCIIVQDLELTNSGKPNKVLRDGLSVIWGGEEKAEYSRVYIRRLKVHGVQGIVTRQSKPSFYGNAAINVRCSNPAAIIRDLRVEDCHIRDVRCVGCWISGGAKKPTMSDVVFRRNRIERTGCDGLIVLKARDVLVEHNRCYDAGALGVKALKMPKGVFGTDYIAGLWVGWYVHNSVFQFNEVARTRTFKGDGAAFDVDNETTGTHIFQYNYTHENEGGPYMQTKTAKPDQVIFRYNVCVNDMTRQMAHRAFQFSSSKPNAHFYNNVFYTENAVPMTISDQPHVVFRNNIFYSKKAAYRYPRRPVFQNNVFFGPHHVRDTKALRVDPKLVHPGPPKDGYEHADNYRIQADSPCRDAGVPIQDNGGRDFWGNPLYRGLPDIGAHEDVK
jgi:hypothetical protein